MKALIDPTQNNRIVQVQEEEFEIAPPFFWKTCPNEVTTFSHLFVNGNFIEFDNIEILEEISLDNSKLETYKSKLLEDPRYDYSNLNKTNREKCC